MRNISLVLALVLCASFSLMAQRTITGTVTDQDGEPLIGASVLAKNTTSGAITDFSGNYSLTVPTGTQTLVYSYTGYETREVALEASNVIDVQLQEGVTLNEAVVTAVGLESNKRALGYAVQNVDADELVQAREVNVVNSLNGKVAGVQITSSAGSPGASSNIRIRGATSIGRSNDPLFVVDGIPISNDDIGNGVGGVDNANRAIDLNPNDIASMTVLKGPAATALYGVRAANGAIVVTTKRGLEGRPTVTLSANYALDQVNKLPDRQNEFAQGRPSDGEAIWRGPHTFEGFSWGARISDLEYSNDPNHPNAPPASAFANGQYIFDRNGFLVPSGTGNGQPAQAYDPYDFFRTGNTSDINLSIQGGTDKVKYYFSAGRLASEGVVPNADFERNSFRLNADAQLTDRLSFSMSGSFINSGGFRAQRGSNLRGVMLGLLRNTPTFDIGNGKEGQAAADDPSSYLLPNGGHRSYRSGIYDNPYWVVNKNPTIDNVNRIIGNIFARYQITDWLSANYRIGVDQYTDKRNSAIDINFDHLGGTNDAGSVTQSVFDSRDLNSDFYLQLNTNISDGLSLSAVVGHNYLDEFFESHESVGTTLSAPDFYNISNATDIQAFRDISERDLVGVYGTVDLNYNDYLFLNLTGRNDWSSTLPEDDNDFQSYSVSAGFAFTEAFGMQNNPILPYGKIRVSYGKVGNDAPLYSTINYFNSAFSGGDGFITGIQFPSFGVNAFERSTLLANTMLVPEATTTFEIGGEFKFFRGRLGLDVTYYDSESTDQIIGVDISSTTGFTDFTQNAGRITNRGVEAILNLNPVRQPNFSWDIDFNFTTYENDVEELAPGIENITLAGFTSTSSRVIEGEPYGAIFGNRFATDDNGNTLIDANGFPIVSSVEGIVGDPNPDWYGGLRNTFTFWKNLTVSALLDIRQGGDMWCGTCGILDYFGTSQLSGDTRGETVVFEGVLEDGTPNTQAVPYADPANGLGSYYFVRYGFGGTSEMNIFDTSWLRLRELTVSYRLPSNLFNSIPVRGATITFTGRNLWLETDYPGIDPETNLTGASNGFGLDYFNMPNTKSYNLGLNVTF